MFRTMLKRVATHAKTPAMQQAGLACETIVFPAVPLQFPYSGITVPLQFPYVFYTVPLPCQGLKRKLERTPTLAYPSVRELCKIHKGTVREL